MRFVSFIVLLLVISQNTMARELTDAEKGLIMDAVKADMKDPESTRFKWVPFVENEENMYCGMVNSKNSFGGYTGDQPYAIMMMFFEEGEWQHAVTVSTALAGISSEVTLQFCKDSGYW